MVVAAAVLGLLLVIGLAGLGLVGLRRRATRIAEADAPLEDRVHRLQRLLLGVLFGSLVLLMLISGGSGAITSSLDKRTVTGEEQAAALVLLIGLMLTALTLMVLAPRRVRAVLADLRGVPLKPPDRGSRVRAGLIVLVAYAVLLGGGMAVIPRHGTGHAVGRVLVYLGAIVVFVSVIAPLVVVRFRTTPMPEPQRDRLARLADEVGVRVRGFRVLKGRAQKVANAAQMGTLPGLRFVIVTDYLLDNLTPEQLDAVVAHELGHARRHHLLIKLAAVAAVWGLLEAIAAGIAHATGKGTATLLTAPVFIAIPFGIVLVQGLVGVRLETAADDVAARQVGAAPLAAALAEVGRLNHTKRRTGRGWALLTQHPGLQARLDRLDGAGDEGSRPRDEATVSR